MQHSTLSYTDCGTYGHHRDRMAVGGVSPVWRENHDSRDRRVRGTARQDRMRTPMDKCILIGLTALVACTPLAVPSHADESVLSGPQKGELLPPLPVLAWTSDADVNEVDFVGRADGQPVLFVFLHERTRPAAALTRVLMNYGEMRIADGLFPAVIRLTDDPSTVARQLRPRQDWDAESGVSPDGLEGPGSYGLNRNVSVTVLVGNKGRVTASFALVQPSVTDADSIISEIVAMIGGDVPTRPETEFLSMNPDAAERFRKDGVAPQNPQLRERICALLRTREQPDQLESAVAAMNKYVASDSDRQRELREVSRLLLNQRYRGTAPLVGDSPMRTHFSGWAAAKAGSDEVLE